MGMLILFQNNNKNQALRLPRLLSYFARHFHRPLMPLHRAARLTFFPHLTVFILVVGCHRDGW